MYRDQEVVDVAQRIYVGNLPYSSTEDEVRELFGQYGEVVSCALPTDRETGRPRGFGFVEMSDEDGRKVVATAAAEAAATTAAAEAVAVVATAAAVAATATRPRTPRHRRIRQRRAHRRAAHVAVYVVGLW